MIQIIEERQKGGFMQGLGMGIAQSIPNITQSLIQKQQRKKQQAQMNTLADQIESRDPENKFVKMVADVYRSPLPVEQKTDFIKSLTSLSPQQAETKARLMQESNLKQYRQKIKGYQDRIKSGQYKGIKQRDKLQEAVDELEDELAINHRRYREGDSLVYDALESVLDMEQDVLPSKPPKKKSKEKFDISNPKHKARADEVLKGVGGDQKKAEKLLEQEFD